MYALPGAVHQHPRPFLGVRGALAGLLMNCVCGWRRGEEPFLSVEVSPLLDAGPEPRKYPKHRGLLREPVQGRRSIACASNAGPVQEMLRRKFTDSNKTRTPRSSGSQLLCRKATVTEWIFIKKNPPCSEAGSGYINCEPI